MTNIDRKKKYIYLVINGACCQEEKFQRDQREKKWTCEAPKCGFGLSFLC